MTLRGRGDGTNFGQESFDVNLTFDEGLDGIDFLLVTREGFDGHGMDATGDGVTVKSALDDGKLGLADDL